MTAPRPIWRDWTAILAAYVLVLQVLLAGLAAGLSASPARADGQAPEICRGMRAAGDPAERDGAPAPHAGDRCCVLGCAAFGPLVAPPPVAAVVRPPHPVLLARAAAPQGARVPPAGPAESANLARAPPA